MIFHRENSVFQFMPFIFVMIAWIAGNLLVFYFIYRNADQTDKIHAAIEKTRLRGDELQGGCQ